MKSEMLPEKGVIELIVMLLFSLGSTLFVLDATPSLELELFDVSPLAKAVAFNDVLERVATIATETAIARETVKAAAAMSFLPCLEKKER
mmetsp:Transcript_21759/g.47290  ORF Transcript_21759/g.47290 Transcript_21759/m.47290 type:complete len:90 (+) Transcript_21759:44-313(+)